ncbi:hypothetical protein PC116_g1557 [Phytophthora cactorum]|nr:hypothetical protein Pcac1_g19424 [Phytophthora cactorum]KAG4250721.1 hypothetical protein PC116_g1557 [Phytophthora cactorum]
MSVLVQHGILALASYINERCSLPVNAYAPDTTAADANVVEEKLYA